MGQRRVERTSWEGLQHWSSLSVATFALFSIAITTRVSKTVPGPRRPALHDHHSERTFLEPTRTDLAVEPFAHSPNVKHDHNHSYGTVSTCRFVVENPKSRALVRWASDKFGGSSSGFLLRALERHLN